MKTLGMFRIKNDGCDKYQEVKRSAVRNNEQFWLFYAAIAQKTNGFRG